jgi:hypothetical protein
VGYPEDRDRAEKRLNEEIAEDTDEAVVDSQS